MPGYVYIICWPHKQMQTHKYTYRLGWQGARDRSIDSSFILNKNYTYGTLDWGWEIDLFLFYLYHILHPYSKKYLVISVC